MNLHQIKELLKKSLVKHLTTAISSLELLPVGGGSINDTYKVIINGSKKYFLKLNSLVAFPGLFEKEKNGLEFLAGKIAFVSRPLSFMKRLTIINCYSWNG